MKYHSDLADLLTHTASPPGTRLDTILVIDSGERSLKYPWVLLWFCNGNIWHGFTVTYLCQSAVELRSTEWNPFSNAKWSRDCYTVYCVQSLELELSCVTQKQVLRSLSLSLLNKFLAGTGHAWHSFWMTLTIELYSCIRCHTNRRLNWPRASQAFF